MIYVGGPSPPGVVPALGRQPWAGSPGVYENTGWVSHREECSSMASAAAAPSRFLPCQSTYASFPQWWTVIGIYKPNKPVPPQDAFDHSLCDRNRNLIRTVTKSLPGRASRCHTLLIITEAGGSPSLWSAWSSEWVPGEPGPTEKPCLKKPRCLPRNTIF